jgi:hypothetical protein
MAAIDPEHERLLRRFRPQLVYDSLEAYFADHPAQMVVNPGNDLRAADGTVRARVADGTLTLETLGPGGATGDCLAIHGKDYAQQYAALRETHPELNNHMVARARTDGHGRLWLQYWLWYFYNDYRLTAGVGLHEGDWEMVQLRLDGEEPDYAVFAQHKRAQRRPWDRVHKDPGNPDAALVFVARGSHASYFRPGVFPTEVWADVCDGGRRSPPSTLLLLPSDDEPTDWSGWPGRWGDTRPRNPAESDSPDGPCRKKQWKHPDQLYLDADEELDAKDALGGPDFHVGRRAGRLIVAYNLLRLTGEAVAVAVNVNSRDEPGVPPKTSSFAVSQRVGEHVTDVEVHPDRTYDVRLSMDIKMGGEVLPSVVVRRTLDPGDHGPERPFSTKVAVVLVTIGEWLKRVLRR